MTPRQSGFGTGWVCASALLACAAAFAQPAPPAEGEGWTKESRQWKETIAGGTVRVVNPHGNIYARFGGYENEVEVLATLQRLDRDLPPLEVEVTRTETGLAVLVRAEGADAAASPAGPERRDRVDLVVFVPQGAVLDAQTTAGAIEVKGLHGDVVASSLKGDIDLRAIKGRLQAKTARGRIRAVLESGVTTEAQEFTTETGEIEVHLAEDATVDAHVATSGEISTDFSIQIEHERFSEPSKRGTAIVGGGGARLTLSSKRGRVRLLRLQRNFNPEER
jgi:hypothetical protein